MARLPFIVLCPLLFVVGALMVFSFAPYSVPWVLPVLVIGFFYLAIQSLTPKQGLWAGLCFGLGYFGFSVNWVYNSIHMFGSAAAPLAGAVTVLFVLVMAVFPAITAWVYLRLKNKTNIGLQAILFSSLWVLAELARGKIMGGFPWALAGYSQTTENLGALAPWIGVYAIGFVVVLLACISVDWFAYLKATRSTLTTLAIGSFGLLAIIVAGHFSLVKLDAVQLTQAQDSDLNVRLVQANIPQELKFSRERLVSSLQQYTALSVQDLPPTDLIIWPETAIPTFFSRVESEIAPFANELEANGIEVLAGGFYSDGKLAYNSLRQLGGDKALYQKRHLVPFGEYMPFRFILGWLDAFIEIPMSDLGKGTGPNLPMVLKGVPLGLSICYEDVFGEEMRELIPASTVLVNVSNDAWFGEKIAPYQHQQKAQMRARELVRPLIRVTNTGVSSVIDHKGQLQGSIPHNTQGFLDTTVTPRTGVSLYARTGNWPIFVLAMLVLIYISTRQSRNTFI